MTALVIGAGPAGLMAAEALLDAGRKVIVADHKPSVARKFLMAGKSGLNLTKRETVEDFLRAFDAHSEHLRPMIEAFGPSEVEAWAETLGQDMFAGSTGRVFPKVMKASPLLRSWLARLAEKGAELRTRWRFAGWEGSTALFDTPEGTTVLAPKVTVLAMGGGSWARLGSDGAWADMPELSPLCAPFQPSNVGLQVNWSDHMTAHFGAPIKAVRWRVVRREKRAWVDVKTSRGEAVLSDKGLEGGGLYPLIPALRENPTLLIDFAPDLSVEKLAARWPKSPKSLTRILRNNLRWQPAKIALFHELVKGHAVPLNGERLAHVLKGLALSHKGPRPINEAISTAGGLKFEDLTHGLELKSRPAVFACGEMLDWDAPTGGYLLTASLATGLWAGRHAALTST